MKILALDWILDNEEFAIFNLAGLVRVSILFPGELGGLSGCVEDMLSGCCLWIERRITFPFWKGDAEVIGVFNLFSTTFLVLWRVGLLFFLKGSNNV